MGRRMDFDIEVAVRLYWRRVPLVAVPTTVIYPAGGTSNFRAVADNVSITKLHVKLFFGMLVRIPLLLGRQIGAGLHWAKVGERGGVWGMRFLFAAYRLLGRGVFTALLYPVVAYFYMTAGSARHASHDYLEAVRTRLAREGRPVPPGMNVFQHVVAFGNGVLDKLAMWAGALPASSLEFADAPVLEQFSDGRGVLFIGSHHGNLEVLRAFGEQVQGLKVNALVSTRNSPN